ncbi:MAG: hypothetical protein HFE84_09020 [Lachnospiraceae bacterium]|nr:hypothetical protein [Lachnospiraceae bacterium]
MIKELFTLSIRIDSTTFASVEKDKQNILKIADRQRTDGHRLPCQIMTAMAAVIKSIKVSESRFTAHFSGRDILFHTVTLFSSGHLTDEPLLPHTFLSVYAVYPLGGKSARKTHYFHTLGLVI